MVSRLLSGLAELLFVKVAKKGDGLSQGDQDLPSGATLTYRNSLHTYYR